ncbi:hypothetical protein SH668x_001696 [Planctomicrobium sp. SH668]|uniref:hypothetical protein n=1 Tax=Planctomicrobium sp. SH668 TaxID=3448126 RepID=UPI003F5C6C25
MAVRELLFHPAHLPPQEFQPPTDDLPSYVAYGPEEFEPLLPQIEAKELSNLQCQIVPVSELGSRLWQSLPFEVAQIASQTRPECILILPATAFLDIKTAKSPGEVILQQNESQVIISSTVESDLLDPRFPDLVAVTNRLNRETDRLISQFNRTALQAGLAQIAGDVDRCHDLAQGIEGKGKLRNGDYWHAILHRREPDYSNAKYWFRNVGQHPNFGELARIAHRIMTRSSSSASHNWIAKVSSSKWDSIAFVDLCRDAEQHADPIFKRDVKQIQWEEMLLLLESCLTSD